MALKIVAEAPHIDRTIPDRSIVASDLADKVRSVASNRPFIFFMLLVAVLAGLYYGVIAAPLYVSEARFSIRTKEQPMSPTGILSGLMGTTTGISDLTAVSDYIQSDNMLNIIEKRQDLRALYSQPRLDLLQWLPANAPKEKLLNFYRRHVVVKMDRDANELIVQAKSFTPQSARAIAEDVLSSTEQFVNGMSERLRGAAVQSSLADLNRATTEAETARQKLASFRGAGSDLDPSASGAILVSSVGSLQASVAQAQSQLASLLTYNKADAPGVKQLKAQIAAINAQIAVQKSKQASGAPVSQRVTDFETLKLNRANAEQNLTLMQQAYQSAKQQAEQQEKYVVRIVNPDQPQIAIEPNRILDFLTVLIFAVAAYAIVALSIAAVRDHRGI